MHLRRLLLVCALGILVRPVQADPIAYEPFAYDIGGDLLDKEGGTGFAGEWFGYQGAPLLEDWVFVEGSLSYPGLQTEGNHVTSEVHFNDEWVGLMREFEEIPDETSTRYLSFLIRPEETLGEGAFGGAFGVIISGTGSTDILAGMTQNSIDYMIEEFFNTGTRFSDVTAEAGVTSLFVIKAELTPGNDTFTLYVNPTPGQPEPATGTVKQGIDVGDVLGVAIAAAGAVSMDELRWGETFADVTPSLLIGDFNGDGLLTAIDIDLLSAEARAGTHSPEFDLNGDLTVDQNDRTVWIEQAKNTWFGDANLDGEFNSADLVQVFQRGKYEDGEPANATWEDGDWNGDGDFGSNDIVVAFQGGGFEAGPRQVVNAVPEPSALHLVTLGALVGVLRPGKRLRGNPRSTTIKFQTETMGWTARPSSRI